MSQRGKPKMEGVNSSHIVSVGYDEQTHTLHVDFHSGAYEFEDVPREVHQDFLRAPSKGSFFHSVIKGRYREKKA